MRDFLTKDLAWKILSLVLATGIYFTLQAVREAGTEPLTPGERRVSRTFVNVPILIVSAAADVRAFTVMPAAVEVTVSGKPDIINQLDEKKIRVTVDLTGIEGAQNLKKLVDVSVPPGVTHVGVVPSEVDVRVPPKNLLK